MIAQSKAAAKLPITEKSGEHLRTTPDVFLALLRGDIDVAVESYGALKSAIDDGQVRPIVSSGTTRSLPNVPTAAESGLPRLEVVGWNALYPPCGPGCFLCLG